MINLLYHKNMSFSTTRNVYSSCYVSLPAVCKCAFSGELYMPPLCKGRWHGVSRDGGIVKHYFYINNPSVASRQLPLHKGAFGDNRLFSCCYIKLNCPQEHNAHVGDLIFFLFDKKIKKSFTSVPVRHKMILERARAPPKNQVEELP